MVQPDVLIDFQSSYLCELKKKMTQKKFLYKMTESGMSWSIVIKI